MQPAALMQSWSPVGLEQTFSSSPVRSNLLNFTATNTGLQHLYTPTLATFAIVQGSNLLDRLSVNQELKSLFKYAASPQSQVSKPLLVVRVASPRSFFMAKSAEYASDQQ